MDLTMKSGYKQKIKDLVGDKLGCKRDSNTGHTFWKVEPLFVPYNSKKSTIVLGADMLKYNSDVEIAQTVLKIYEMNKIYDESLPVKKSVVASVVDKVKSFRKSTIQEEILSIDDIISMKDSWILGTKKGLYQLKDYEDLDKRKLKSDIKYL